MSAPVDAFGIGLEVESQIGRIKILTFILRNLVVGASADTGFTLTDDDREGFAQGSQLIVELIDEQSATIVDLVYKGVPKDEQS